MSRMLILAALVLAACGRAEEESPMEGMTAEEHARMMAGGTQGAFDSAGSAIRQPVHLTAEQERALGVSYVTVARGPMVREIRTVGDIVTPETSIAEVTTRVEGFVETLAVTTVGEQVRKGQPMLTLYSPMLVAAQEELLAAQRLRAAVDPGDPVAVRNADALVEASRQRLALWNVPEETVVEVGTTGDARRLVTLRAPVSGIVLEKMVLNGQRVMPGMTLYRVADLSTVWVEGDVFEQGPARDGDAHRGVGLPRRAPDGAGELRLPHRGPDGPDQPHPNRATQSRPPAQAGDVRDHLPRRPDRRCHHGADERGDRDRRAERSVRPGSGNAGAAGGGDRGAGR